MAIPLENSSPVALCELSLSHLDDVAALERRSLPNPWSKALLRAEFGKTFSKRLGLFSHGRLIGHQFSHLLAEELHILTLCIDPQFRRRGLGKLLLERTLLGAYQDGARSGWLEVRVSNLAALSLYEQFGFVRHSVRQGYYSDNGEDAVVLYLSSLGK